MSIFNRGIATEPNDYEEQGYDEVYINIDGKLTLLEVEENATTEER